MSPRTQQQLEEIRRQSRKKILDAALKLFAEGGFHNTSVSGIAKEAGVSKGLIYNYFDSKEDLMRAIIYEGVAEGDRIMEEFLALDDPRKKFRYIIEIIHEFLTERYEYNKLTTMLALKLDSFPDLTEMATAKYSAYLPLMAELLAELGHEDPEAEARLLTATFDGIGMQYLVLKDGVPMRRMLDDLIRKYCS